MGNLKWSNEEVKLLKKIYPKYITGEITKEEMVSIFKYRTFTSIKSKAIYLGLSNYKPPDSINREFLSQLRKRIKI